MKTIPVWDLRGSTAERGRQQGEMARERYHDLLDTFFGSELWKMAKPKGVPNGLIKLLLQGYGRFYTKRALQAHLPIQHERVAAIGQGAGAGAGFTWALAFLELLFTEGGKSLQVPSGQSEHFIADPTRPGDPNLPGGADAVGCTMINARPNATRDGAPLMGRNYDFPKLLVDFQIVRRELPTEARRLATMTVGQTVLAGCHQGINEKGLSISLNNSRPWLSENHKRSGVPGTLLVQEALETCSTTEEAVAFISNFGARACSKYFGIMDESGDLAIVESTPTHTEVRRADEEGVLVASNHAHKLSEMNPPDNALWTVPGMEGKSYMSSCRNRWSVAHKMLVEAAPNVDVDTMKAILCDHSFSGGEGSDETVCCHGAQGISLASSIFNLKTRELHVAKGPPCEHDYQRVEFPQA